MTCIAAHIINLGGTERNMSLFSLLGKKEIKEPSYAEKTAEGIKIRSGMRVEVVSDAGQLLFVAMLLGVHGKKGELHQYSEYKIAQDAEPLRVSIRGYIDYAKKAVYMEGTITPGSDQIWQVEDLNVVKIANERAFFRLDTDIDAAVTMFSGAEMGERPCKLLNVSVGGAYIESQYRYYTGDKFLLKFKLLEDRPTSLMYCQVVRAEETKDAKYRYGCQFLELTEKDQTLFTQNIFEIQCQKRAGTK